MTVNLRLGARRSVLWLLGVAAVVVLGSLAPLLFNHRYYFFDDTQSGAFGIWYHLGQALRAGHWPIFSVSSWMAGNYTAEGQWGLFNPAVLGVSWLAAGTGNAVVFATVVKFGFLVLAGAGTFLLARSYRASDVTAFAAATAAPLAGFTTYMDGPSWVTGLIAWSLMPWAWWGLRRAMAGRGPALALLAAYLIITVGYVHGTIALAVVIVAVGVEAALTGRRRGLLVAVAVGAFSGLVALAVYLPGVLTSPVTVRQSHGISNDDFLVADLSGLAEAAVPTAQPQVSGWWGDISSMPLLYVSWLLPMLALVSWRRVRGLVRETAAVLIVGGFALAFVMGPSAVGPLRFPIRMMPYVVLAVVVIGAVLLANARAVRPGPGRLAAALSVVLLGVYLGFAQSPRHAKSLAVTLAVLAVAITALWLQAGGARVRPGSRSRTIRPSARRPAAVATLIAVVTVGLAVWQHHVATASGLPDFGLPGAVADYQPQLTGARNDVIVVGAPTSVSDPAIWHESLLANTWYLNPALVQNTYTPLSFRTYAERLCMNWRGETCPDALETLLETDPATNLPLVDELSIDTIQVIKPSVAQARWAVPPVGWHVVNEGKYTVTWVRESPRGPAGGVVWSSPGLKLTELSRSDTELRLRVDAVPAGGGSLIMSRLAWPGYTVDNARLLSPDEKFLLTAHVDGDALGREIVVRFSPPGWSLELSALVLAVLGGLAWSVAVGRRRRRGTADRADRSTALAETR